MLPTLRDGDRVLVRYRALWNLPRRLGPFIAAGDIVVARLPDGVVAIKRAAERRGGGWWLLSDNPEVGSDSRHRGAVAPVDVWGRVTWRVWPRPKPIGFWREFQGVR